MSGYNQQYMLASQMAAQMVQHHQPQVHVPVVQVKIVYPDNQAQFSSLTTCLIKPKSLVLICFFTYSKIDKLVEKFTGNPVTW